MTRSLLDVLACPTCGRALMREGDFLKCAAEARLYPVVGGIPRFIDAMTDRATGAAFGYEFQVLDPEADERIRAEDAEFFFRATGYLPGAVPVRGKLVLDAGCGAGRFAKILADAGAHVVAIDVSDAVERVASATAGRGEIDLLQCDLRRPPFRDGTFDHVFSIGVLHHTPDTRDAFAAIARLVRPGGVLSVWVYGRDYWGGAVRGALTRTLRRPFLKLSIEWRARIVRHILLPIGRLQMRLARRRLTKFLFAPLFVLNIPRHEDARLMAATIFDYWAPPAIHTHTVNEVRRWFVESGFTEIETLPMPVAVRGRRATGFH